MVKYCGTVNDLPHLLLLYIFSLTDVVFIGYLFMRAKQSKETIEAKKYFKNSRKERCLSPFRVFPVKSLCLSPCSSTWDENKRHFRLLQEWKERYVFFCSQLVVIRE